MQVRKIDLNKREDVEQFIQFPYDLYRGCPQWVPPLKSDERLMLNPNKYHFYRHSVADFFVVESGGAKGETLGRIAAIDNRRANEHNNSHMAQFYFFEAIDDAQVAGALFDAVLDWATSRGLNRLVGPQGLLRADGLGLLVEGFEYTPAPGIPYNYAYYDALMTGVGLVKERDYVSAYLSGGYRPPERVFALAEKVKKRSGFWIQTFRSKRELRALVPGIKRIYNESFSDVPGCYPIDDGEVAILADRFLSIADPRLIKLVMKGDEVAGFLFAFPDITPGLQKAQGRLWPTGWYHLLRAFKQTNGISVNGMGLLPQYQGVGAPAILYAEMFNTIQDMHFHFEHVDLAQIEEYNTKSLAEIRGMGGKLYKRHRIYQRDI
ncbi:MAG: hypothetical protein GX552_11695 [Chloroflexi bacterium]|nr:hypothetical protein [Chloroflexota bacterium]